MRKRAIITSLILLGSIALFVSDMLKSGYMEFVSFDDIKRLIPNTAPPQFAQVLEGNTSDCLTKPTNQTKPVSIAQIRTLRQLTDKEQIDTVLGNFFCQTTSGFKYLLESKKELIIKSGEILDYDFSTSNTRSLTNDRTANRTLLRRSSEKGVASEKETRKIR